MNHNDQISRFRQEDLEGVLQVVRKTIHESYPIAYPPEAVDFFVDHNSKDHIQHDARDGHTLILRIEEKIIGTGTLLGTSIRRLFVLPAYQGKGYGKQIMVALENLAASQKVKVLDLTASLVSKHFYESLGYTGDVQDSIEVENGELLYFYPMTKAINETNYKTAQPVN